MKKILIIFFLIFFLSRLEAYSKLYKVNSEEIKVLTNSKLLKLENIETFQIGKTFYIKINNSISFDNLSIHLFEVDDVKRELFFVPNDEFFDKQWYLKNNQGFDIDWVDGIDLVSQSNDVIVAVLDSGIAYSHVELKDFILTGGDFGNYGFEFCDSDDTTYDIFGHGTHVAGLIAAKTNNSFGMAGVSNNRLKILNLKIACGTTGSISLSNELEAASKILDLIDKGYPIRIVNMSFGGEIPSDDEKNAIDELVKRGVIVVSAAGNSGADKKNYPAAYDNVIAVGGVDENGELADFSNFGDWVDIYAPGDNIISTYNEFLAKPESNPTYLYNNNFDNLTNEEKLGWDIANGYLTYQASNNDNCDLNYFIIKNINTTLLNSFRFKKFVMFANINVSNGNLKVLRSYDNGTTWNEYITQAGINNGEFFYIMENLSLNDDVSYKICYEGDSGKISIDFVRIAGGDNADAFTYMSGTSMATPIVSASVALGLIMNSQLRVDDVEYLLKDSGEVFEVNNKPAYRLNLYNFLDDAKYYDVKSESDSESSDGGGGGGCSAGGMDYNLILLFVGLFFYLRLKKANE